MDDHGQNLTPEEEILKAKFAAEDADPNTVGIELPDYIPLPSEEDLSLIHI